MKKITFFRNLLVLFALLLGSGSVMGQQTFYQMSTGNYSQNFDDIINWTNNYAAGIGASNWRVASSVTTSTVNSFAVFVTGTLGGIQRGTGSLILLATGTNSTATDLLLDFTGREAGTLSLDFEKVINSVNASPRSSDLKIQYSTDNSLTFTDLTGYNIPRVFNNSVAETGSLSVSLPSALNNISMVVLRFYAWNNGQTGGSGNRPKISIDNIVVTSTSASGPVIPTVATPTFTPASALYFSPVTVSISTATDGATIRYTTNGDEPTVLSTLYEGPFTVSSTTTVRAIAFKDEMTASAIATATYTFPVLISDIATLRSQATGSTVYRLTSEAVLTLQTATRNAKYIQDATAGILIDDPTGIMASAYAPGDGITGITGTLGVFAGMLQFTPVVSPGVASSVGNVIVPKVVTLAELDNHPAQLVTVSGVLISDIVSGTGSFVLGNNYSLNSSTVFFVRAAYSDLPWIGQAIPATQQDVTGVVLFHNANRQIVPRTGADFIITPVTTPVITVTETTIPPMQALVDATDSQVVTVSGQNLTGAIALAITGDHAAMFSLSTNNIAAVGGSVTNTAVTITYAPTAAGNHTATLTLSSDGASSVTRTLTGVATVPPAPIVVPNVIITEVYGGGGNSGAEFKNDFVELYNNTIDPVNIGGWSLQYYSAAGSGLATAAYSFVFPANTIIPSNSHFLVQAAAGSGGTMDLPAPNAFSSIAIAATAGKVILYTTDVLQTISSTDINSITGNPAFKDYVPFGTTAVPVWGSAMGSNVSNTNSAQRRQVNDIYVYTQNIGNDFNVALPTPQPALSTSASEISLLPVIVQGSQLRFEAVAGQRVEVFSAVGQQLYSNIANDGWNTVNLNARGVLIVRVGDRVTKVIM